uniref:UNC45 homolog A (UNC-45A) (Stromal membrane-associated protein 1) (Smap-1) n=1 Tax=mine drainage metagenome TaxID=410659 RepID=E6PQC9_9ZZZZ
MKLYCIANMLLSVLCESGINGQGRDTVAK